jgi:hypothetical protein
LEPSADQVAPPWPAAGAHPSDCRGFHSATDGRHRHGAAQAPCPGCGEPRGARYGSRGLCWPCLGLPALRRRKPPEPAWVVFRRKIIDALARDGLFIYIDANQCGGVCPVCDDVLHVRFVGEEAEADLTCLRGCDERKVAAKLGRRRRRG